MGAVAATVGDAAQLLDVQVDQLAGVLALVAYDHPAGPVGVGKAAQVVAAQHSLDRGARHGQVVAKPMGTLAAAPGGQQPRHLGGRERMGRRWGREDRSASPAHPWAR